ncbi:MAG: putative PhoH-like protein [Prokaryotic dsDNA virus sp.]|nr:MAG: putative PhoH-like protein [Prokaryotic dsDNA virus sp.]|tara:strand:+ start:2639 stop:3967 length:1329 start_codon:yes stop_codon:yes gene_type:complete
MAKKNLVIDTSVFLSDASCIFKLGNADIFIAFKVLEEIDKHKKRQDSVGYNARKIIKIMDEFRAKGCLSNGVRIGKGKGIFKVEEGRAKLPEGLSMDVSDHQIIATALYVKEQYPKRKTVMLSRDINFRVISDSVGIPAEDYVTSQVVDDTDKIFTGLSELVVDDELIDQFYADEEIIFDKQFQRERKIRLYCNQFVMLISSSNDKKTALGRYFSDTAPIKRVNDHKKDLSWGVVPRNKEQSFAYDLLFDDDVPLISLIGRAGSGKTLMAIAAAMEQTLGFGDKKYNKIVISRPVQPMGKDIGFLPGDMKEKMLPWLMPIQDNLQTMVGDKVMLDSFIEQGKIEIEALTYIRGRSINNAFMIIDEAQNLTAHEVKTIITRVGENTKVVLTGDIEQIDNLYTNETSNGLTYAVERFKEYNLAGHVTFTKGERSRIATLASKIL